jgi:uncharacterized protein YndB with AHSA1/START domain/DNA-binding transcriptional ArsR family regulator
MIEQATIWLPDLVVEAMDAVFRALAHPERRRLLDSLDARNGQSLVELGAGLAMSRQAVAKHLAVLEAANLVTTVRRGREKRHYLNAAPINDIADRWISRYDRERVRALADLKHALESTPMTKPELVYTIYIRATPEQVWQGLTAPEFTRRYWGGVALVSDWRVGSPVLWQSSPDGEPQDWGQVVLAAEPYRRLSYSWHPYQREHAEMLGWTDEQLAEAVKERRTRVTFELELAGESVKLTIIHDDFEGETTMLKMVSVGWPALLSDLKTLLEIGDLPATPKA